MKILDINKGIRSVFPKYTGTLKRVPVKKRCGESIMPTRREIPIFSISPDDNPNKYHKHVLDLNAKNWDEITMGDSCSLILFS